MSFFQVEQTLHMLDTFPVSVFEGQPDGHNFLTCLLHQKHTIFPSSFVFQGEKNNFFPILCYHFVEESEKSLFLTFPILRHILEGPYTTSTPVECTFVRQNV